MTIPQERHYDIYPIRNPDIYALLDKAHCVIVPSDDDSARETLIIAASARYENIHLHNDIARFDVYCATGLAFTLIQTGRSVHHTFVFHHPALLAFPTPLSFREALDLASVDIYQLMTSYPFPVQSLYDMLVNLPVPAQDAAFALAKLSITSQILFTFDNVTIKLLTDPTGDAPHA
jgi:hypothetical protein